MLQHDYHDFVGFSSVEHNDLPILWIEKLSKNRSRFSHHPFFGSSAWWWSWNWNLLCESFQKSFFSEEKKNWCGAYWELIDVSRRRLISHSLSVSQFFKRTEYHYVANVYVQGPRNRWGRWGICLTRFQKLTN